MKRFFLPACLFLLSGAGASPAAVSGGSKTDSLENVLAGPLADSTRVKTLMALAGEHYLSDPELAINDCEAALALSEKIKLDEGTGEALGWLAYLHEQQGNIDLALAYYNRSLAFAVKTKSKNSEAAILNNLAAIYNDRGQIEDALQYHDRSLAIRESIGDAYMCAGGLPVPNSTHPEGVVLAGLEMQRFIRETKIKRESKGQPCFELRVGIHTGPVVAGIVGIKKFAYDIWGDTVNTASRMESSGEVGKVNISGTTHALVKDKFNCTYRGKIEAKNKGAIEMYFAEPAS